MTALRAAASRCGGLLRGPGRLLGPGGLRAIGGAAGGAAARARPRGARRHVLAVHDRAPLLLIGQHRPIELVLVGIPGIVARLDRDLGDEGDAVEVGETAQPPLGLGLLAVVVGIEPERAVDHRAEGALGDVPADRGALLVDLAARDGEGLPELAAGEAALGHGELAVEAQHVAAGRGRRLEQAPVDLGLPVDATRPDGHDHLGEGAVGDQVGALLRLDVAEVVHVVISVLR